MPQGPNVRFYIVDPDIEALIRKEIGEFDKDNPKYAYLKDEDSAFEHLRQGKEPLSFQQKVPENYEEMEKMVEEHKKTGAHANRENEDYEEEEAEYEKRVDLDLQSYIDQINSEPMEHAAKAYEDKESEGHDFMEKYGFPDFNFGTELNNKERVRKYQKGKKEATHEHSRWEEAMKDSEFWKN